jgi:hypothetical protein
MKQIDKLAQKYALNINQLRGPKSSKILDFKNLNIGFYDILAKNDNSIKKNRAILKKVKDSAMKEFIYTNKEIPESWRHKSNYGDEMLKIMVKDKNMLKYMGTGQTGEINNKNNANANKTYNIFITRNENEKALPNIKKSFDKNDKIDEISKTPQKIDEEKNPENIITEEHVNELSASKESKTKIRTKPKNEYMDKEINDILEDFKINYPIKNKLQELYDKTNFYSSKNSFNHSMTKDKIGISSTTKNLRANSIVNSNKNGIDLDSKFSRNIFYNTIKNQQIFKRKNVIRQNVFNNLISNKENIITKSTSYKAPSKLNPIVFSDYKNFIKKIKVKNPLVNRNLESINFYGPYFSYCPPCYNKNIEYYNNLEVNQCVGLLHHIKKMKTKEIKKSEMENKFLTSKETEISTIPQ